MITDDGKCNIKGCKMYSILRHNKFGWLCEYHWEQHCDNPEEKLIRTKKFKNKTSLLDY